MKFYSLKNFIKFFAKIKKVYRNSLAFKKKLKKKIFYLLVAGCTILAVVIVSSFQFSNNRHQKKTESNLSTIQKNFTKTDEDFAKKKDNGEKDFEIPPLGSLQNGKVTNKKIALEKTNKNTQKEEILKLLEKVNFQKQSKIIIIIDDFGYSESKMELFLQISQPITFAILPNLPKSSTIAKNSIKKTNKNSQKEEILKLLEKVHFQKQSKIIINR